MGPRSFPPLSALYTTTAICYHSVARQGNTYYPLLLCIKYR